MLLARCVVGMAEVAGVVCVVGVLGSVALVEMVGVVVVVVLSVVGTVGLVFVVAADIFWVLFSLHFSCRSGHLQEILSPSE